MIYIYYMLAVSIVNIFIQNLMASAGNFNFLVVSDNRNVTFFTGVLHIVDKT